MHIRFSNTFKCLILLLAMASETGLLVAAGLADEESLTSCTHCRP